MFPFHQFQIGKRLIKTAVAVFMTAQICYLLNWPMIFAVITAIVTVEPTVDASIRKGLIRFPAAAIGAAFAMIFEAWLGPQPLICGSTWDNYHRNRRIRRREFYPIPP